MTKSKRMISVAGAASTLALFAFTGAALAQSAADKGHDGKTGDAHAVQSASDHGKPIAARGEDNAGQLATRFGVAELNDIEDWKVTNSGRELGEIDRLGVDRATGEMVAVVGLKGVVGVNMKEVAVPLSNLKKAGDETLATDLTKDELQRRRDIDPWDGTNLSVRSHNELK
jgi:hypothetical protein